jgi:hypothetical protein
MSFTSPSEGVCAKQRKKQQQEGTFHVWNNSRKEKDKEV